MSMYTKDIKESGQKIYFLNDDNIAFDKNVISCAAGFNAVASQEEFTEVYSELTAVSSDFYKLSSKVETSAATLDGKIDGVSAAVDIKFLPLSGGAVDHLSVSNGLKVSEGLTAYGLINTDQVKTSETGDITVSGRGVNRHGSIDIQFEGGMNSISVNGASLSSYIRESINELDVNTVKAGEGKIFDEIKQRDGKISATIRKLEAADIPELPVSKISHLEDDYATKVYADSHISALTDVVTDLVAYAAELSAPATGAIDVLSAGVDSALSSTALTVKFLGHIIIHADETPRRSFKQILEDAGLFYERSRVKNGSMYQITYLKSSGDPVGSESRYQTTDGLVLGDGDYVYVHKHGFDTYVQADEIAVSGDNKTVYLADPVHRYDLAELSDFVIDNFVKLSGNNEIGGGNLFHGVNSFDSEISVTGNLSVGFDKLFDLRDGKSLNKLSCEISTGIKELSTALSGEIDTLSAKLSGEIKELSSALSSEIKELSVELSTEISSRAMLSVDDKPVQEFRFQHISQEDYHDLVLGEGKSGYGVSCDPNTLYVVSSDNMSMYGQKITDLADGELSDDACTYGQLSAFKAQIKSAIDKVLLEDTLEENLSVSLSAMLKCLFNIKMALA